jgi:hypothetical protein
LIHGPEQVVVAAYEVFDVTPAAGFAVLPAVKDPNWVANEKDKPDDFVECRIFKMLMQGFALTVVTTSFFIADEKLHAGAGSIHVHVMAHWIP